MPPWPVIGGDANAWGPKLNALIQQLLHPTTGLPVLAADIDANGHNIANVNNFTVAGLPGATDGPVVLGGAITSGPPVSGTFPAKCLVFDLTGRFWWYTAAGGSPGTWVNTGGLTSPLSANLPAGGNKITGLAAGSAAGDSLRYEQQAQRRTSTTNAPGATPSMNTDNFDTFIFTGLAAAITSMTTGLGGSPVTGQTLWVALTDNGTARAITWGASFESSTATLPTTTVINARLDVGFVWNPATTKWRCVAVA